MLTKNAVKLSGQILLVLLWLGTLAVTLIWTLDVDVPFDPEPVTVLLGLASVAVTAVVSEYARLLKREEYTAPYALAYGYVHNFVEPAITKLLASSPPGEDVQFYIYIPDQLSDLSPRSVDRIVARVKGMGYRSEPVNLELEAGRARDILTLYRDGSDDKKYFDLPNTLLTLTSLVDYKIESKGESFDDEEKRKKGREYIKAFEEAVRKFIREKGIEEHVHFTDSSLTFLVDE